MSFFNSITEQPPDPIFILPQLYAAEVRPQKVNLGVGSYRDQNGLPHTLNCVKEAEYNLLNKQIHKEYLPIDGHPDFLKLSAELIFGKELTKSHTDKIYAAQTLGGTGALRIGGEFLAQTINKTIFIPTPTWPNHKPVFLRCGMDVHSYKYCDDLCHQIDFNSICQDIVNMPSDSIILLQANCHNPTGLDFTNEQWFELAELIKKQNILPFFDFAYQGFGESLDKDAEAVRHFVKQDLEVLVANSFSKNFSLYSERIGVLFLITKEKATTSKIGSHIKQIIRQNYSNPPRHGAEIVSKILESEFLKNLWIQELSQMRNRIKEMREALVFGLQSYAAKQNWSFLNNQHGFFCFLDLTKNQVQRLIREKAIYIPADGRINLAGLNEHNLNYVIQSISEILIQ